VKYYEMTREILRYLLHALPRLILAFLSGFFPKNERKILFISTPDFSDNAKYVYDKMVELRLDKTLELIWLVKSEVPAKHILRRSITLMYLYHVLTSKYLIATHEVPYWKSRNQTMILLWHGFPTKGSEKVGRTIFRRKIGRWLIRRGTNYIIATSDLGASLFSFRYRISRERILVLGQPRCDALFNNRFSTKQILEKALGETLDTSKIILYVPTWRDYDPDSTRRRVMVLIESSVFRLFLRENNLLFIFKPHHRDEHLFQDFKLENIQILTNRTLLSWGLQSTTS
jgi:CDP-glycerol glycerophosphotransferase